MKKKSLLFTLILMFICTGAYVSLTPQKVQAAINDHLGAIEIWTEYDYNESRTEVDDYNIGLCFDADATIEKISFVTPKGNSYEFGAGIVDTDTEDGWLESGRWYDPENTFNYKWCYERGSENSDGLDDFGDGTYTVTLHYLDASPDQTTTACFGVPGTCAPIPEPTTVPVFTNIQHGDSLSTSVTFNWNACSSPFNGAWFELEDYIIDDEIVDEEYSGCTEDSFGPITLSNGLYEVDLGFETWHESTNSDGIDIGAGKGVVSDTGFFVTNPPPGDPISNHISRIEIDKGYTYQYPGASDDEYAFDLCLWTDDTVNRVSFIPPQSEGWIFGAEGESGREDDYWYWAGMEYDTEKGANEWCFEANADSLEALEGFGDGNYSIAVYYNNNFSDHTTVWFGIPDTTDPIVPVTQKPVFTNLIHESTITSPFTFEWNACTGSDVKYTYLGVEAGADEGEDIIEGSFPGCATDSYGPITLDAGSYEVDLEFENFYETTSSDGISALVGKYSYSEYLFTVENNGHIPAVLSILLLDD
jgi:hypothetical protein